MTSHPAVRLSADVVFRELDGQTVLLDFKTGRYFGLNAVGTRLWALIAEGAGIAPAIDAIAAEFDAPRDEIARDVEELVTELVTRGLLVREGQTTQL